MRTIIINTLGRELPRQKLFFLPFRDDQMFWMDQDMGLIGACAEKIERLSISRDKRQDYRLIVLADLAGFESVDKQLVRECYQQLLRGYLNYTLIEPLARQRHLPPQQVTVIFVVTRKTLGSGNVQPERVLDYVLGLDTQAQPFQKLVLTRARPAGTMEQLDISGMFAGQLRAHNAAMPEKTDESVLRSTLKIFRQALENRLRDLQKCSYTPDGSDSTQQIPLEGVEFFPQCSGPELVWADLQLNLSGFLADQVTAGRGKTVSLELTAHTDEELAFLIARGTQRIRCLLTQAPGQTYYPLENGNNTTTQGLYDRIWTALLEQEELLPGVREAKLHSEEPDAPENEKLHQKLRRAWLRVDVEKKQFRQLCDQLEQEYNADTAEKQQQAILDICAEEFRRWRSGVLERQLLLPEEPTATVQPELETQELEDRLREAQTVCGRMAAEKLEDYVDLRRQAEVVKADCRKTVKFWAPDCGNANTRYFRIYSIVLAALFLLQMLVPYIGITLGQSGVELSRYVHFLASAAVFAVLYMVGLLLWLRQLCKDIHSYSDRINDLIYDSSIRRRDSIEAVVRAYGEALPQCTILHEDLRQLRQIHEINCSRKARYNTHMNKLKLADELLREMDTRLQLPAPDMSLLQRRERVQNGIDYQRPPSDSRNIPYYMLLSEEWGDKRC